MIRGAEIARPDAGRRATLGSAAMVLSSVLGGAGLIFARLAYGGGTTTTTLLLFRFALVVVALLAYLTWKSLGWRLSGGALWLSIALAIAHGISSYTYLGAVHFIPVSLAVLIVYTYPSMVGVLSHFFADEPLTWRRVAALALSYGGLAIALELSFKGLNAVGLAMALVSALSFAATLVLSSRAMKSAPPIFVQLHVAILNVILLAGIGWIARDLILPTTPLSWAGFLGLGFSFLVAFLMFAAAVYLIGPSRTAMINNLEPVVAIVLSIVVLHEAFGVWQVVGGALVLAGVVLAQ